LLFDSYKLVWLKLIMGQPQAAKKEKVTKRKIAFEDQERG